MVIAAAEDNAWITVIGYRKLVIGYRKLVIGYRKLVIGYRKLVIGRKESLLVQTNGDFFYGDTCIYKKKVVSLQRNNIG